MSRFAIATRDELWARGRLIESRLSHGEAIEDERGIVATDARHDDLVDACDREIERLREVMPRDARARIIARADSDEVSATMTVRIGELSIVTMPESAANDIELLRDIASMSPVESAHYRGVPLLWRIGSASVLLHEAIGHATEYGHEALQWPSWLSVEAPLRMRRASFSDVPLRRMVHLTARQNDAPFELPRRRIEVWLVSGGNYEPLTQTVTLRIAAADYVGPGARRRLHPFEIRETRGAIARSIVGATGPTNRYPGVVCAREGQELVVGSFAPAMMTTTFQ